MGLEDQQLRWLVNHMGHTEKVHLQNYRSTSGLIERLDIAKIMLLQEKMLMGNLLASNLTTSGLKVRVYNIHVYSFLCPPNDNGRGIKCYPCPSASSPSQHWFPDDCDQILYLTTMTPIDF